MEYTFDASSPTSERHWKDFLGDGTADPIPANFENILVQVVVQKLGLDPELDRCINLDLNLDLYFDHDRFHDLLPILLAIPRSTAKS